MTVSTPVKEIMRYTAVSVMIPSLQAQELIPSGGARQMTTPALMEAILFMPAAAMIPFTAKAAMTASMVKAAMMSCMADPAMIPSMVAKDLTPSMVGRGPIPSKVDWMTTIFMAP